MTNEEIIREELDKIAEEAKALYNSSGKRVSGKWEAGIDIRSSKNRGELWSYAYLAGRGPTKKGNDGGPTLQDNLLIWIKARGIKPIQQNMSLSTLAYFMAQKIHEKGTDPRRERRVFEEVLTPQRIQKILDKVGALNVETFVRDTLIEFNKIAKDV